jgi:hypothetical protein
MSVREVIDYLREKCYPTYFRKSKRVEFFCGEWIEIPNTFDKIINENGWVTVSCWACCGYIDLGRRTENDRVIYYIIPCMCHPWGTVLIYVNVPSELESYAQNIAKEVVD